MMSSACAAVTLNQIEDFSGVYGWTSGDPNPNPPVPDSGPLGGSDISLRVSSNGGSGSGGRLVVYNNTKWSGDYLAAGIFTITADLRNLGSNTLSMRLAFNGAGGWFVTVAVPVTAYSGWSSQIFDIRPETLVSAGGDDIAATMAGVSEIRILHSTIADFRGAKVTSSFNVDNIRAVPEPSACLILGLAGLLICRRTSRASAGSV